MNTTTDQATAADWAALRRIYDAAQALRYAMRDAAAARGGRRKDADAHVHLTLRTLRTHLEHAALSEQHPGESLLAEMEEARELLDDSAPTLRAAVESTRRLQRELIAAYQDNETALHQRIARIEADAAAWLEIVNDLYQLGCLDCSNNACDRAREALGVVHPGESLLARLEAAQAVVQAARLFATGAEPDPGTPKARLRERLAAYDAVTRGGTDV